MAKSVSATEPLSHLATEMRVKRLELFGFKSFAHKTTLHFEPGVTAIVGPNGSGKTNIVDAVRWVLGEHNPRDLRAPRLEDVIFNGTEQRAPVSVAEVSLTIANEQGVLPIAFSEVTVSRRVYRSGESECFINQSPCRLRDIQELFLGTGLGGGTYAIIEQGHIDLVLSSKPEERRIVFEEASGIAKYLAKKQETLRRLDEVEAHLVRIADITSEVRRQLSALERQAAKARRYKADWEDLKRLEIRLATDELSQGESDHTSLKQLVGQLGRQRDEQETQKQTLMASLQRCNEAVSATQQRFQESRTRFVEVTGAIDQHTSQQALKSRWIEELASQTTQLEADAAHLRQRADYLAGQIAQLRATITELDAKRAELSERLKQDEVGLIEQDALITQTRHAVEQAKAGLFEAATRASNQRNELAEMTSRHQALEAQATRLSSQNAQLTQRLDDTTKRWQALERDRLNLQKELAELSEQASRLNTSQEEVSRSRHELLGRLQQLREQVVTQRAQVALCEELWRRYEGFPETVKALMASPPAGVVGPLVDLLEPTPGYERALEAALGPLAEAIVVEDRAALLRCRARLTERDLSGARFVVLSELTTRPTPSARPPSIPGAVTAIADLVRANDEHRSLMTAFLEGCWLIDEIQALLSLASLPSGILVSKAGDRWDGRSWELIGAHPVTESRFGRRARWESAAAQLRQFEAEYAQLEASGQQLDRRFQQLAQEHEAIRRQLDQRTPSLSKLEAQLGQLNHDMQRMSEERSGVELELEDLSARRHEIATSFEATRQAVGSAEATQHSAEASLQEAQQRLQGVAQRKQDLLLSRTETHSALTALTEQRKLTQTRHDELTAESTTVTQQLDAKRQHLLDAGTRTTQLTQQVEEHNVLAAQLACEQETLKASVEQISQELAQAERERSEVLPTLLEVEQKLSAVVQELTQQSQRLSERTFRRERILERLRELYRLGEADLDAIQQGTAERLSDETRTNLTQQIERLKTKLESMGPVSLGSVEEYDELKQRLEFLQTQQSDLLKARDDLKASISQINRTARQQFRETFAKIAEEFQRYFTQLFGGGKAELMLLDEDDVLETGIEIVARPPGKKLQSISLLSGGERALTAIALLFALFKVRPSPFCILDEIDAPLDEANVDRFTRVLEEFLSLSQFILVTHNKKTITKADCLYGVTMEEAGVSKLVSVKLKAPAEPASVPTPVAA